MNNSHETKQADFDNLWLNSTFSNTQIKDSEHVKVCVRKIFSNYLHFDNIKVIKIYDTPECSASESDLCLSLEYEDSTNLNNSINNIQINLDLLDPSSNFIPACINFQ